MSELPYPQNHPHYIQGVYAERERIIALLEANPWKHCRADCNACIGAEQAYDYINRLIKGENE